MTRSGVMAKARELATCVAAAGDQHAATPAGIVKINDRTQP
jgi:hypothetical protein